jgi:hypothetical protein
MDALHAWWLYVLVSRPLPYPASACMPLARSCSCRRCQATQAAAAAARLLHRTGWAAGSLIKQPPCSSVPRSGAQARAAALTCPGTAQRATAQRLAPPPVHTWTPPLPYLGGGPERQSHLEHVRLQHRGHRAHCARQRRGSAGGAAAGRAAAHARTERVRTSLRWHGWRAKSSCRLLAALWACSAGVRCIGAGVHGTQQQTFDLRLGLYTRSMRCRSGTSAAPACFSPGSCLGSARSRQARLRRHQAPHASASYGVSLLTRRRTPAALAARRRPHSCAPAPATATSWCSMWCFAAGAAAARAAPLMA